MVCGLVDFVSANVPSPFPRDGSGALFSTRRSRMANLFGFEESGDLGEAAGSGVLQGGDAVAVGDGAIGARVEQELDDALGNGAAIGKDHRFEEGRPAEVVDVVDVDA